MQRYIYFLKNIRNFTVIAVGRVGPLPACRQPLRTQRTGLTPALHSDATVPAPLHSALLPSKTK